MAQENFAIEVVSKVLDRAFENLKFAEAKNAAMITFGTAWFVLVASSVIKVELCGLAVFLFFLSAFASSTTVLISVYSMFPLLSDNSLNNSAGKSKLMFFFDSISNRSFPYWKNEVKVKLFAGKQSCDLEVVLDDYLAQIHSISRITSRKHLKFKKSSFAAAISVIFGLLGYTAQVVFLNIT